MASGDPFSANIRAISVLTSPPCFTLSTHLVVKDTDM
jgi:hypothetical protein